MATQKSTHAAPAAPVNQFTSPPATSSSAVYRRALSLLDEFSDERENILSVAIAGSRVAGEDSVTERRLFDVIVKMSESIVLFTELRVELAALARHAGLTVEAQS